MATTYKLGDLSRTPSPDPNRMSQFKRAAEKLSDILKSNNITHAFYGGFALLLLGNTRVPADIDVLVDEKLSTVRAALEGEKGIVLPDSKMNDGVIRIFVTIHGIDVHVDIFDKRRGLGRNESLGSVMSVVSSTEKVPVLNYSQFVNAKLKAWCEREETKDAKDILFLVVMGSSHINKSRLDQNKVSQFCHKCPEGLTEDEFKTVKDALK